MWTDCTPTHGCLRAAEHKLLRGKLCGIEDGRRIRSTASGTRYNWSAIGSQIADMYEWMLGGPELRTTQVFQ
jgi:hypothetical protein